MNLIEWRVNALEDEKVILWFTYDFDDPDKRVQSVRYKNLTNQDAILRVVNEAGDPFWSRTLPANTPDTGPIDLAVAVRPSLVGRMVQFDWPAPPQGRRP